MSKLRNKIEIIGIVVLLFASIILFGFASDGALWAVILLIVITGAVVFTGPFRRWRIKRYQQANWRERVRQMENQLLGRTKEKVLERSPFSFGRSDHDTWLISDSRTDEIVETTIGEVEAEMRTLELTLADERK